MINRLSDLEYRVKRLAKDDRLILATVRPDEQNTAPANTTNPKAYELLLRSFGYVDICARKNAEAVSENPLVLYRPRSKNGRPVSGRQAKYLRGEIPGLKRTKQNAAIASEDDDFEIVTDHEAIQILNKPNPYMRGMSSLRFVSQYAKEMTGNSYEAWIAGESRLYPLSPQYVRALPDENDAAVIARYSYGRDTASWMFLETDEIIHGRLFDDFRQPYYGISWLNGILDTADLWGATESYLKKAMQSSGRPDLLIWLEGSYDTETWEQTQRSLVARMKRSFKTMGAFFVGAHEGKPTATQLGHSPKDMTSVEIGNDAERTIGNAAGIPEPLYRMNSANLASSDNALLMWKRDTIMPRCVREAEERTEWLHANWTNTEDWFFAPENCVPVDVAAESTRTVTEWNAGLIRRNEARTVLGYDPIEGPEGDELYSPAPAVAGTDEQANPLAGLFGRSAEPEEMPTLTITRRAKVHDPGDESDHAERVNTNDDTEPAVNTNPEKCSQGCDHAAKVWVQSEAWSKTPETLAGEGEQESPELVAAYKGLVKVFREQMDDTLAKMDAAPMGLKGANPRRYADTKAFEEMFRAWGITDVAKWAAAMESASGEPINREYAQSVVDSIRLIWDESDDALRAQMPDPDDIDPASFIIEDDRAAVVTRRFADRYAESMTEGSKTTAEALARTLSEGLEAGEGLGDLQDRVRDVFVGDGDIPVSEARAARIARTEVAQAQTEGRIAGMAGSRVVMGYKFVKANSACPICDAVQSKIGDKVFGVDEAIFPKGSSIQGTDGRTFKFDYQDTIVPIHPNCRCEVRPVLIDME